MKFTIGYDVLDIEVTVLQGGSLPKLEKEGMSTYEVLSLFFLGGTFFAVLLAYIDRTHKHK